MQSDLDIDNFLLAWSHWPGSEKLSAYQQLMVRLRLRQLHEEAGHSIELYPGAIGSLICQSPAAQQAFTAFCVHRQHSANTQSSLHAVESERDGRKAPLFARFKMLLLKPWFLPLALPALLGVLFVLWLGLNALPYCHIPLVKDFKSVAAGCETAVKDIDGKGSRAEPDNSGAPNEAETVSADNSAPIRLPVFVGEREHAPVLQPKAMSTWIPLSLAFLCGGLLGWLSGLLSGNQLINRRTRLPTTEALIKKIDLDRLPPLFFYSGYDERLTEFHYRNEVGNRLDTNATIDATVKSGLPVLAYQSRKRRVEYVLVHPQQHIRDWQGGYFAALTRELEDHGVLVTRYAYTSTPARLYPVSRAATVDLEQALLHHRQDRWILVVYNESLLHPLLETLFPWTESLASISHYCLVHFGVSQSAVRQLDEADIRVRQLGSRQAFNHMLAEMTGGARAIRHSLPPPHLSLPARLAHLGSPHRMYDPPPAEEEEKLILWLKNTLPLASFKLFCASVVYPRPDWRITRVLAESLAGEQEWHQPQALQHGSMQLLAPLLALPWVRHTHFPEWLRRALINELSSAEERTIGAFFLNLLKQGKTQRSIDPLEIRIDRPDWNIARFFAWARGENPVKDALFASVLDRSRGAFRHLPRWLSKLIRYAQLSLAGRFRILLRASGGALAMFLFASAVWFSFGKDVQQRDSVSRQCNANRALPAIKLYAIRAATSEAKAAATALSLHCYNVDIVYQSRVTADQESSLLPSTDIRNTIVKHALYELPFEAVENNNVVTIFLSQSLHSGQIFRDRFTNPVADAKPHNIDETDIEQGTVNERSEASSAVPQSTETGSSGSVGVEGGPIVPEMVDIPAGDFLMGSADGHYGEQPVHRVTFNAFQMASTELTWAEWQRCEDAGVCKVLERPTWLESTTLPLRHPVVNASWDDAVVYIDWLNSRTDGGYRLPSEAEWEYAARATTQSEFNTGDCISSTQANFDSTVWFEDCAVENVHLRETAAVKSYPSNQWELFDVHGNVWEWTEDCWNETYRDAPDDGSAWITGECDLRVLRGGGWDDRPVNLRSANRFWSDRVFDDINVGFRLARTP